MPIGFPGIGNGGIGPGGGGSGGGAGTVTAAGTLTSGNIVVGNGASSITVSIVTIDASGDINTTGNLTVGNFTWTGTGSGNLSSSITATTQSAGDSSTKLATTAFVNNAVVPGFTAVSYSSTTSTWTWVSTTAINNGTIALTGTSTQLSISGGTSGMQGVLVVTHTAASSTITLPAGSKVINNGSGAITWTSASGSIDVLAVTLNGTSYLWNYGPNYT